MSVCPFFYWYFRIHSVDERLPFFCWYFRIHSEDELFFLAGFLFHHINLALPTNQMNLAATKNV